MALDPTPSRVAVLATGGTIAGTAPSTADDAHYTAAQLGVAQLLAAVPGLVDEPIDSEQVAQIDSKDMSHAVWQALALRVAHHLARPEVAGIVITHGSDTLEETAYFLQRVLAPLKPVVLTAAMRPATSLRADGPQNIRDAITAAREPGWGGVVAVVAGVIHDALDVRKAQPHRLEAFSSGDAGPLGVVEGGRLRWDRPASSAASTPSHSPHPALTTPVGAWPRVEIVASHAGATGAVVRALTADGVDGLVVVATGSGTLHHDLEAALLAAQAQGVAVLRSLRCGDGRLRPLPTDRLPGAGGLTPAKARVALMLDRMAPGRR